MIEELKEKSESQIDLPAYMNASVFYGPEDIRYEKVNIPEINDDEILVKVKVVLTCGTDLKTYLRGHPVLIKNTPALFGHQFSGIVVKIGKNVSKFKPGDKVIPVNSSPCFKCVYCKREKYSLCENILFLNGAYADYVKIPREIVENNMYKIPEGIPFETAAILESLAVVHHGLERSEVEQGKTVCIIGTGSIGLLFLALAKRKGVKVISLGRSEEKLKLAKNLGADYVINIKDISSEDIIQKTKDLTAGLGPDVVIEAVGIPEIWELATKIVCRGGVVNFFGGCKKGTKVEIDTFRLHYDELKLLGVFHHTPEYVKKALDLLAEKQFQDNVIKKIISNKMKLSELEKAFLLQKSGEVIQVAIEP